MEEPVGDYYEPDVVEAAVGAMDELFPEAGGEAKAAQVIYLAHL